MWQIPAQCPPNPFPLQPARTARPQFAAFLAVRCGSMIEFKAVKQKPFPGPIHENGTLSPHSFPFVRLKQASNDLRSHILKIENHQMEGA